MALFDFLFPVTTALNAFGNGQQGSGNNPFSGEFGLFSNPTGAWDKFKNGNTNDINKQIADENLQYQRERNEIEDARYEDELKYNRAFAENERDYQRALQQQIFDREDTAYIRQAEQLSSMGINPLSQQLNGAGAGQALSPSPVPAGSDRGGQALHNDFKMQDMGVLQAITPLMSLFQGASELATGNLSRDSIREQNDYQRLLNQEKQIENRFKEIELSEKIKNVQADTESKKSNTNRTNTLLPHEEKNLKATSERNERENAFQEKFNVSDGTNKYVRLMTDLANTSGADSLSDFSNSPAGKAVDSTGKVFKSTGKALENTYNVVSKALSNTVGKGASAIYDYFVRKSNQAKKKKDSTIWRDKSGKKFVETPEDLRP